MVRQIDSEMTRGGKRFIKETEVTVAIGSTREVECSVCNQHESSMGGMGFGMGEE
ncbi:hypothetical protein D3C84_560420 [compost metagenome]